MYIANIFHLKLLFTYFCPHKYIVLVTTKVLQKAPRRPVVPRRSGENRITARLASWNTTRGGFGKLRAAQLLPLTAGAEPDAGDGIRLQPESPGVPGVYRTALEYRVLLHGLLRAPVELPDARRPE